VRALLALFLVGLWAPALANDVAIALIEDVVEIDAGFAGASITLFGVVSTAEPGAFDPADYDIAAVVKGPTSTFRLRPFEREQGVWTAGPAIDLVAPGVQLTLSTRPVGEIAPLEKLRALGIGADADALAALVTPQSAKAQAHLAAVGPRAVAAAFIEEARRRGLIDMSEGSVDFRKAGLFSIRADLPPTTPTGEYAVDIFLFRNRELVSRDLASLSVRKIGLEAGLFDFAQQRPIAYGLTAVLVSALAGLCAAFLFRRG
jgi:uncharacterized protein (TIGR02186 family)